MVDVQERRMAKIKMTARLRSPDKLLVERTSEGNLRSASGSHRSSIEVESTRTSSFSDDEASSLGREVLKKRGRAREEPTCEVVAEGIVFPGALEHSDIRDGLSTHFPNHKVVASLKSRR